MKEEEIDLDRLYEDGLIMDDLSDEEVEYLDENDPDRLAEIGGNTNDYYRELMFPEGDEDD